MRESRDIMCDLAASGLSMAQQALVMELVATVTVEARPAVDQAAENKRAYDRAYHAERRKNRTTSHDSHDINDAAPSLDKKPPDPEKLIPTPCVRETRAREAYHRLPEGWRPTRSLPDRIQAKADQWPPGALESELARMHLWAANAKNEQGKGRKLDWDKAWWNWIERRHDEHYGRRAGAVGMGRAGPDPDGLGRTARAAIDVFGPPVGRSEARAEAGQRG